MHHSKCHWSRSSLVEIVTRRRQCVTRRKKGEFDCCLQEQKKKKERERESERELLIGSSHGIAPTLLVLVLPLLVPCPFIINEESLFNSKICQSNTNCLKRITKE